MALSDYHVPADRPDNVIDLAARRAERTQRPENRPPSAPAAAGAQTLTAELAAFCDPFSGLQRPRIASVDHDRLEWLFHRAQELLSTSTPKAA